MPNSPIHKLCESQTYKVWGSGPTKFRCHKCKKFFLPDDKENLDFGFTMNGNGEKVPNV